MASAESAMAKPNANGNVGERSPPPMIFTKVNQLGGDLSACVNRMQASAAQIRPHWNHKRVEVRRPRSRVAHDAGRHRSTHLLACITQGLPGFRLTVSWVDEPPGADRQGGEGGSTPLHNAALSPPAWQAAARPRCINLVLAAVHSAGGPASPFRTSFIAA